MALTKVTGSVIKDSVSLSGNVSVGGTLTYQDVTNVDALGIGTFRTGINVLAGQVDVGSNIKIGNAGVITATSFVGSGANLTSLPTQVTITGNADNRVITGGSGTNLVGESKLTFDGTGLLHLNNSTGSSDAVLKLESESGSDAKLTLDTSNGGGAGAHIEFLIDGTLKGGISYVSNASASDTHDIIFKNNSNTERLRIDSVGSIGQGTATPRVPDGSNADNPLNGDGTNGSPVFTIYGDSPAINLISSTTLSGDYSLINFGRAGGTTNPYRAVIGYKQSDDILRINANNVIAFDTGGNINTGERFRIDSAGRFLKGLTSAGGSRSSTSVRYPHFQLSSPWSSGLGSYKIECTDDYPIIFIDSNASYANGTGAGVITWSVKDGSGDYCNTASVRSLIDGTPSNDNAPGRLEFMTTTSGTSPTTKMTISSEGYVTKPSQPYFKANLASGVRITGTGDVVFGAAVHNNGNHYNTSNGRFTAPVNGLYWFSCRINAYDRIDFKIRVDGTEVERGQYNTDNDQVGWWSNQLTTITYMTAGQYCNVNISNLDQNTDPDKWCTFMGYLLG